MQQYLDMMRHVRDRGARKDDRTGTGTLSVAGAFATDLTTEIDLHGVVDGDHIGITGDIFRQIGFVHRQANALLILVDIVITTSASQGKTVGNLAAIAGFFCAA